MYHTVSRAVVVALFASVLAVSIAAPTAKAASCFQGGTGEATFGNLTSGYEADDFVRDINDSEWTGNHSYYARRYYSNGTISYGVFVSGGAWQYGTSGNVTRYTAIKAGSITLTAWAATQWSLC